MNRTLVLVMVLAALVAFGGCKKKQPGIDEPLAPQPTVEPVTAPAPAPAPAEPAAAPAEPAPAAAPVEPAPAGGAVDACATYVERSIACLKEQMGGAEPPAEALAQAKAGYEQGCEAMKAAPNDAFTKAIEACKDKPCADYAQCVATETSNAAMAAAGAAGAAVPEAPPAP